MLFLRFAIKLLFFLIAEAVLWFVASICQPFGSSSGFRNTRQHRQLVDWLCGRKARQSPWHALIIIGVAMIVLAPATQAGERGSAGVA